LLWKLVVHFQPIASLVAWAVNKQTQNLYTHFPLNIQLIFL